MKHHVLAVALLLALPVRAPAQDAGGGPGAVLTSAISAYQDLDFDRAAVLLRRALSGNLSDSARAVALTYLGAAEHYRSRPDSAAAAFRRLALLAPRYEPDTLVFPPEITRQYNEVRNSVAAQQPVAPIPQRPGNATDSVAAPSLAATARPKPSEAPASSAPKEERIIATAAGTVSNVRARSEPAGLPAASGAALGMTLSVRVRRFELGARYLQGSLGTRDLVEGAAALRFDATTWLNVYAGQQIRRYDSPFGAERWATWQLGARGDWAISGEHVRGHAMLWQGFGLRVNVPPGSGSARGGEVGVTVDPSRGPFSFGLSYGVDRAAVSGSTRRETVQTLQLTAGLRHPH